MSLHTINLTGELGWETNLTATYNKNKIKDLNSEGVIRAVGRLVLSGQDKLAAKETVRMVVQRGQMAML